MRMSIAREREHTSTKCGWARCSRVSKGSSQTVENTFLTQLRRRLDRERDVPMAVRLKDDALAAVRYVTHAAVASFVLDDCDKVGVWVRTPGGSPNIDNRGSIEIGAHVVLSSMFCPIRLSTGPRGSIHIGSASNINFGVSISANRKVVIGKGVSIGPYSILSDSSFDAHDTDERESAPIEIGDNVWLAGRVTVLPGARIGAGSVITAGSIVSGEIPPGVVAGGIPARVLRSLNEADRSAEIVERLPANDARQPSSQRPRSRPNLHLTPMPMPAVLPTAPPAETKTEGRARTSDVVPKPAEYSALVISDFTIQEFADRLSEDRQGPSVAVEVAPFAQVTQTLLSLPGRTIDLVVVWALAENCIPSFRRVLAFEPVTTQALLDEVDAYAGLLVRSLGGVKCAVIPTWTLPSYNRGLGMADLRPGGASHALMEINKRLVDRLAEHNHIHVLNAQRWTETAGRNGHPPKLWYMGKVAFHSDVFQEAVSDVKAALSAVTGRARKLVIVDLDDTLWGGIVGDVGWEGLRLGGHDSQGEAFVDFQRALKHLTRRGILLAIVSKNEQSVALEAIRKHGEMVLREQDFAGYRINWTDKARNVADLVAELNLGLQSVVFIDDNPVERARVREALPEVLVPEWPEDKHLYASTLLNLRCFDAAAISAEDQQRTAMMQAERQRDASMPSLGSIDEWIKSLDMQLRAEPLSDANIARTVQLLNKTNQMNLSTRRLTEAELRSWSAEGKRELWALNVSDRFGDSGLTGIVSVEVAGDSATIVDCILSCRVMGRKVEEALLHIAVETARRHGAKQVTAKFLATAKNKPCLEFFKRSGFTHRDGDVFTWDATAAYPLPDALSLVAGEG